MISVNKNPKENFEYYRHKSLNKKHKGMKKGSPGVNFEVLLSQIILESRI